MPSLALDFHAIRRGVRGRRMCREEAQDSPNFPANPVKKHNHTHSLIASD